MSGDREADGFVHFDNKLQPPPAEIVVFFCSVLLNRTFLLSLNSA